MHICPDEIAAAMLAMPFIGWFCIKCRQFCQKCIGFFKGPNKQLGECTHHNHKEE